MTRPNARRDTRASASPPKATGTQRLKVDIFGSWYCQPHQDPLWKYLVAGGKRAAAVWHRRAGKDDVALHWTKQAMLDRPGTYWHLLPQAEQARKAIWDAVNPHTGQRRIDEAFPRALRRRTRENEMKIEFKPTERGKAGSIWQVVGSDNYNSLVGSPPVGVVFSEWSLADPAAWAYISPILRENGGWAIFLYTPRGRNHGLSTLKVAQQSDYRQGGAWFWEVLPATATEVFSSDELAEELKEKVAEFGPDLGQAYFDQEFMCSFDAAVVGAIYAAAIRRAEREGRVGSYAPVPGYPINTAWDLGYSDATGIWWWQELPGPEIRLLEYFENSNQTPAHYAEQLYGRKIVQRADGSMALGEGIEGLEHRRNYKYGKHFAPHDAANKVLAAGGRSFGDQMFQMGFNLHVLPQVSMTDGITAGRRTLEYCTIDRARCQRGLDALESYHFPWDEKHKCLKDEPLHDWSSHGCDALEIIAQVWKAPRPRPPQKQPKFLHEASADDIFWGPTEKRAPRLERL